MHRCQRYSQIFPLSVAWQRKNERRVNVCNAKLNLNSNLSKLCLNRWLFGACCTHGFMLKRSLMASGVVAPTGLACSPSDLASVHVIWTAVPGVRASALGDSGVAGVGGLVLLSWMSCSCWDGDTGTDWEGRTGTYARMENVRAKEKEKKTSMIRVYRVSDDKS